MALEGRPKEKKPLPPWVIEKLPLMLIGAIVAFYIVPVKLLGWFAPPPQLRPVPHAVLITAFGPKKSYIEGSSTAVRALEVTIRNLGDLAAEGVQVSAVVRGGKIPLSGPSQLATGETASYAGPVTVNVSSQDSITIETECGTCATHRLEP